MTTTRTKMVPIRMTPEEVEALTEAARRAGLGLGPWLRSLGMAVVAATEARDRAHREARKSERSSSSPPRGKASPTPR